MDGQTEDDSTDADTGRQTESTLSRGFRAVACNLFTKPTLFLKPNVAALCRLPDLYIHFCTFNMCLCQGMQVCRILSVSL